MSEKKGGARRSGSLAAGKIMSIALRDGVSRLEVTTKLRSGCSLWRVASTRILGSAICYGNATIVFFAAVIYAVAVSVGIYAFWTF